MRFFSACLLGSASTIALMAGSLALPSTASAQCTINGGANVQVVCGPADFDDTLTFDPTDQNLSLSFSETSVSTDLSGNDRITLRGNDTGLNDTLSVFTSDGEFSSSVLNLRGGNDRVFIEEAVLVGAIEGGAGNDSFIVRDSTDGTVGSTGEGSFAFAGGTGNDTILIDGSTVQTNSLLGDAGNDIFTINDGNVVSLGGLAALDGGADNDILNITGGQIDGSIEDFETINIDVSDGTGISGTLQIVDSGTTVNILDSDLTGQPSLFDLSGGIRRFNVQNSSFGLTGAQGIDELILQDSTFNVRGNVNILGDGEALGVLAARNSVIDMRDGAADDSLTVNAVIFRDVTLRIDVDPNEGSVPIADQLNILDLPGLPDFDDAVSGTNVLQVDFTDAPSGEIEVDFVNVGGGDNQQEIEDALETFTVEAIGDQYNPLRGFQLQSEGGGTVQLVSFERETVSVPTNISNGATASQAGENVEDVNNELSDAATGFGKQRGRTQISPTFGVFSTGQFGRTYHDGYRVRGGGTSGAVTPAFTGDSFSVIGTGELDASAQFNLEDIGLRISAFGGYAQNYVQLDRSVDGVNFTPFVGTGFNESGIFGGSVLVSKIAGEGNLNYGLVSAAGIFGSTNIRAADTGGRGSYGTQGVVISGKAGRNLAVSDNVRLDVRFGAAFNHFHGDGFTDDLGTRYGSSTVTAGQVSFEPGVSTAVLLGDVVVSPSARLLFIQRVGNDNSASVNGTSFTFEDADFTLGGQVATTFDVTDRLAAGIAVEGRVSEDDRTLLGKLSLTYLFGGG